MATIKQKISPCLWFDTQAEDAAKFYPSVFKNSAIKEISRYGKAGQEVHGKEPGSVMVVAFEIEGQTFTALNGGPHFKFNEAVSFQVMCDSQDEIDYFWEKLSADGGETIQPFRTLPGMTDPDPFLAVMSSSTALLLVAFALAATLL